MQKLDGGFVEMNKQTNRKFIVNNSTSPQCIDKGKLDKSDINQSKRKRTKSFVNMKRMIPRDDKMYRLGEWFNNCANEEEVENKRKFQQNENI